MPYPSRATIPDRDIHAPYTDFVRGAAPRRVNAADPSGLVAVILRGATPPSTAAAPPALPMPDFAGHLNDDELAQLATFVRGSWTNHAAPVSAGQVAKPREARAGKPWPAARASPISPSPRTAAGRWRGFTRPLRRITRRAPGPSRPQPDATPEHAGGFTRLGEIDRNPLPPGRFGGFTRTFVRPPTQSPHIGFFQMHAAICHIKNSSPYSWINRVAIEFLFTIKVNERPDRHEQRPPPLLRRIATKIGRAASLAWPKKI
ncbi:c-type cytochrome [Burkholderia plantarii]|uniref:c-type cytochrome n=1 Tax=Burkholderia plantarii TaxID=41899 RepID=UPI00114D0EBC|nr:cytochrome c [Burkholderia plantarii]